MTYTEKFKDLKELKMYQNQIREMTETELREFIEENKLTLSDPEYLSDDEVIEVYEKEVDRMFESAEDDILDSICNGNWTFAVEQMLDLNVYPDSLVDYINDYRYEVFDEAYEWFTLESAVAITELFYRTRKVA
jgi:hypothetical protein